MEKLLIVTSQENVREFETNRNGQKDKVLAIDLTLTDGLNNFICTAFDREAMRLKESPLKKGDWITADLTFDVRVSETEKGKRAFQSVRLNKYVLLQ